MYAEAHRMLGLKKTDKCAWVKHRTKTILSAFWDSMCIWDGQNGWNNVLYHTHQWQISISIRCLFSFF